MTRAGRSPGPARWRVRLEVEAPGADGDLDPEQAKGLFGALRGRRPALTLSPAARRFGATFECHGDGPEESLREALAVWREAVASVGLPGWPVVRTVIEAEGHEE